MRRSLFTVVAAAVAAAALLLPGRARGDAGVQNETQTHALRFFLGSGLVADLGDAEVASRLGGYADALNAIFSSTRRRFAFDPSTGVVVTGDDPMTGWCCPGGAPLPEDDFEVWVRAELTDRPEYGTYGGYMSMDSSGAGVAAGLRWAALWDVDALDAGSPELEDFWRQVDHMAHEIAHVFGAGVSEYYSLISVQDKTGVSPHNDIEFYDYPGDPYWGARPDFVGDVLLRNIWNDPITGYPSDLSALLATAQFSNLSRAVIDTGIRNSAAMEASLPDLSRVRVVIRDADSGAPLAASAVTVWEVRSMAPYLCEVSADGPVGADGLFTFDWGSPAPFNNVDHLRLVKARADGYAPAAAWVSVFDAQAAKLVDGLDTLTVELALEAVPSDAGAVVPDLALLSGYPNPFNPYATIRYTVTSPVWVRLVVFDARGAQVAVLHDGPVEAGEHAARWDTVTRSGRDAVSGVYFFRLAAGGVTRTTKMVLVR